MARSYAEAPATHFRLKPETWAIIAEEYKNGATARDLAAKWKVAPTSVYCYACRDGWTKKSMGDARARAHARMVEEEESASRSLNPVGSRALKSLFAPAPAADPDAGDPAALAQAATLASGRAMKGRLWAEAKALAGLAESYGRLGERAGRSGVTAATMDLVLLLQVLTDDGSLIRQRFGMWNDPPDHPDRPLKQAFWEWHHAGKRREAAWRDGLLRELWAAEERLKELGQYPPPPLPKFATAPAWERGPEDVWPGAAETAAPDSALPPDNGGA